MIDQRSTRSARRRVRRLGIARRIGLLLGVRPASAARLRPRDRRRRPVPPRHRAAADSPRRPPSRRSTVTTRSRASSARSRPRVGRVLIRHEEIPGFMRRHDDAVQARRIRRSSDSLHPGDKVEGTLHVEKQDGAVKDYQLRDLKVTKPAGLRAQVARRLQGEGSDSSSSRRRLEVGRGGPRFHDDRTRTARRSSSPICAARWLF